MLLFIQLQSDAWTFDAFLVLFPHLRPDAEPGKIKKEEPGAEAPSKVTLQRKQEV